MPNGKYYYYESSVSAVAYLESKSYDMNIIKVLLPNGNIKTLEEYSPIMHSLVSSSYKKIERIYYFED